MPLENNNRLSIYYTILLPHYLSILLSLAFSNSELCCNINEQAMYDDFKKFLFSLFRLVLVQVTIYFIERRGSPIIVMSTIISQGVIIFADFVEPNELFVCTLLAGVCVGGGHIVAGILVAQKKNLVQHVFKQRNPAKNCLNKRSETFMACNL